MPADDTIWARVSSGHKQHARVHVRWFEQLHALTTKVERACIVCKWHHAMRRAGANNDNRAFVGYRRVAVAGRATCDVMYRKYVGSEMHV
jgi:hypothetical protein